MTPSPLDSPRNFREKAADGEVLLGLCNMYPAPGIIEGMAPGWDFVWIDAQHGEMDYRAVFHAIQAAQLTGVATIVRVPGHEPGIMGPFADLSPTVIMVPLVNTPEEAQAVSQALHFPPLGNRSFGARRAIDLHGRAYCREHQPLILAQVETRRSLEHAAAIAAVEGIDGLMFGPDDMKMDMGLPGTTQVTEETELKEAMAQTARAARNAGKFAACIAATPETLSMALDMGYRVIVAASDSSLLRAGATRLLEQYRGILQETPQTSLNTRKERNDDLP